MFFCRVFITLFASLSLKPTYKLDRRYDLSINMALTGIADKMSGVLEFLSGQQKITENNIEDTLKVSVHVISKKLYS